MNKKLFLDDYRIPLNTYSYTKNQIYLMDWDLVTNYNEFINYIINNGVPDVISFDHDLGHEHYTDNPDIDYSQFNEKTGYDCAKWLIDYCLDNELEYPKQIYIHSMNPYGSLNIESLFKTVNKIDKKQAIEIFRYNVDFFFKVITYLC